MKESQILENWTLGKYSPGLSSMQLPLCIFCSWITDQAALHFTTDVPFLSILELVAHQWCNKWFQIQSLGTGSLSKGSTEDITAREILLVFQRPWRSSSTGNLPENVLFGIPIIILLPVCSKDKMLLSTVRSKVVFLAWWSSKEEFWLCQLCMSMGLIPAFFLSRHQITRLELDSKKSPQCSVMSSRTCNKSSRALRVISALTITLEKASVTTCISPMAKANPAAALVTSQLVLTLGNVARRQICLRLGWRDLLKCSSSEISG